MADRQEKALVKVAFNACSEKAFSRLPASLQGFILEVQSGIQNSVLRVYPGARATSGFRCACENGRVGGLAHSLHLVGMARDFVGVHLGDLKPIPGLKQIPEPKKGVLHCEVM